MPPRQQKRRSSAGGSTPSSANAPPPWPRERREKTSIMAMTGVASYLFGGGRDVDALAGADRH